MGTGFSFYTHTKFDLVRFIYLTAYQLLMGYLIPKIN